MALGRGGHSTKGMQRARQDDYSDEDDYDVRAAAPMRLARQAIDRMGLRACRLPSSARTCARIAAALAGCRAHSGELHVHQPPHLTHWLLAQDDDDYEEEDDGEEEYDDEDDDDDEDDYDDYDDDDDDDDIPTVCDARRGGGGGGGCGLQVAVGPVARQVA